MAMRSSGRHGLQQRLAWLRAMPWRTSSAASTCRTASTATARIAEAFNMVAGFGKLNEVGAILQANNPQLAGLDPVAAVKKLADIVGIPKSLEELGVAKAWRTSTCWPQTRSRTCADSPTRCRPATPRSSALPRPTVRADRPGSCCANLDASVCPPRLGLGAAPRAFLGNERGALVARSAPQFRHRPLPSAPTAEG